uniref:Uncharacterized protein n=1 Tax=Guillardia theta TaxID=55529 RepID=A0A7S4P008_GUITH|mmetsp:Transcript_39850/g.125189  ORF Transcript_39850/g.125189 Transcript_39850/m.125189 type:complete len:444 (+) Transcript_39850:455-1786(+)
MAAGRQRVPREVEMERRGSVSSTSDGAACTWTQRLTSAAAAPGTPSWFEMSSQGSTGSVGVRWQRAGALGEGESSGEQHKSVSSVLTSVVEGSNLSHLPVSSCSLVALRPSRELAGLLNPVDPDTQKFAIREDGAIVWEGAGGDSSALYPTLTVGVLGGYPKDARESLMNSLQTWIETNLLQSVNETIIFLQDIRETDFIAIPRDILKTAHSMSSPPPRVRLVGADCNIGIGRALYELVSSSRTKHFLFLEDDWVLPFSSEIWRPVMDGAMKLIQEGRADVVRLKSDELSPQSEHHDGLAYVLNCSRFLPPHPPHFFCACLDHTMQPEGGWEGKRPHLVFNDVELCYHRQLNVSSISFYCLPSRSCKYTNTPTIFHQRWFLTFLGPTAYVDPGIAVSKHFLEDSVNDTWPARPFVVGVPSSGLFMHMELDDKAPGATYNPYFY